MLVCCTFVFSLTLFVLQAFPMSRMVMQPFQVVPYVKHFLLIVVITHFLIGAFYFTVGTLTRNAKVVYGLAAAFYPLFVVYGLVGLSRMPLHWRSFFDMFLLSAGPRQNGFGETAEYLNQLVVTYTPLMIANRVLVVIAAAVCLTILCLRFAIAERSKNEERLTIVKLATPGHGVYFDAGTFTEIGPAEVVKLITPLGCFPSKGDQNGWRYRCACRQAACGIERRVPCTARRTQFDRASAVGSTTLSSTGFGLTKVYLRFFGKGSIGFCSLVRASRWRMYSLSENRDELLSLKDANQVVVGRKQHDCAGCERD